MHRLTNSGHVCKDSGHLELASSVDLHEDWQSSCTCVMEQKVLSN